MAIADEEMCVASPALDFFMKRKIGKELQGEAPELILSSPTTWSHCRQITIPQQGASYLGRGLMPQWHSDCRCLPPHLCGIAGVAIQSDLSPQRLTSPLARAWHPMPDWYCCC